MKHQPVLPSRGLWSLGGCPSLSPALCVSHPHPVSPFGFCRPCSTHCHTVTPTEFGSSRKTMTRMPPSACAKTNQANPGAQQ